MTSWKDEGQSMSMCSVAVPRDTSTLQSPKIQILTDSSSILYLCWSPALIQKVALPAWRDWAYGEEKNFFGHQRKAVDLFYVTLSESWVVLLTLVVWMG